jgi:hypothetical protein
MILLSGACNLSNYFKSFIFLIILLVLCTRAMASPPVVLKPGVGKFPLGPHLELLQDKEGKLTLRDVLKPEQEKRFIPATAKVPNFGFTKSVIWAKFILSNPLHKEQLVLLEEAYPHIDHIQLFVFRNGKQVALLRGGDGLPFANNSMAYRNFVFKLLIPPQSTTQIYMRFQTESSMQLPLTIWRPLALAEKINVEQMILGVYFGIMGSMLLYNLFLFVFLRDKNYLYYILYIAFFILAQLGVSRLDLEFLWPTSPTFANLSHPVFFNLTFFFGGLFCRSFLSTKKQAPYIDRAILLTMGVSLLGVLLTIASGYTAGIMCVVYFTAIFGPIFMLAAGIRCWAKGLTIARYYTIAWSVFLVGAIAFNLRNMGVLPSIIIIDFSPHIGSAVEVIFLSLALGDRINIIRNEKLAAQAKAFEAERALTEALEKQVAERTSHIKRLSGLLPICASCKKIRDDKGYWQQVEQYLETHSDAEFSHAICPDCMRKLYPEVADKILSADNDVKQA